MRILTFITLALLSFPSAASIERSALPSIQLEIYQNPEAVVETLKQALNQQELANDLRFELQLLLSEALLATGNSAESKELALAIIEQAKDLESEIFVAKGTQRLAVAQLYQGDFELSLANFQQALEVFNKQQDQLFVSYALNGIANVYGQLGQLEQALDYYLRTLKIQQKFEQGGDPAGLYNNIGSIHFWLNDFEKAIQYYQLSIEYNESINETKELSIQYSNIGEAYTELGNHQLALENFQTALSYANKSTTPLSKVAIHIPLGKLKLEFAEVHAALEHFDQAIELSKQSNAQDWLVDAMLGKAQALKTINIVESIKLAHQALKLASKINKIVFVKDAHGILSQVYAEQEHFKKAYYHATQFNNLNEQIIEQDRRSEIVKYSGALELEQKNHKIELLTKEKAFQEARLAEETFRYQVLLAIIILLIISLIAFYRQRIERKQANKERQVANKLRRLDKLKDEFLANTSHELRTPLNAIIGLSNVILESKAETFSSKQLDELIKLIKNSGERLQGLVNDILDLASIKENKLKIELEPVQLSELVDRILETSQLTLANNAISLEVDIPKSLPPVKADFKRLSQIMVNLVDNAIKFTPQGIVKISSRQVDDKILIAVEDTGIGIPENRLQGIFNRFVQVDGSNSRSTGGTGLGLSIVKNLLALQAGSISLTSKEGEGSRFEVVMPVWTELENN